MMTNEWIIRLPQQPGQTVSDLPAGRGEVILQQIASCCPRANYTDYSCESCMAELYNYTDPVHVIKCCAKRQKKNPMYLMEIFVLQVAAPLGDFRPCVEHYRLFLCVSTEIFY